MKDNPQKFTEEDYLNYGRILKQTNTIYQKIIQTKIEQKAAEGINGKILLNLFGKILKNEKKKKKKQTKKKKKNTRYPHQSPLLQQAKPGKA